MGRELNLCGGGLNCCRLNTNVLVTRISSADGIAQVVDYMPVGDKGLCLNQAFSHNVLVRQISGQIALSLQHGMFTLSTLVLFMQLFMGGCAFVWNVNQLSTTQETPMTPR